MITLMDRAMNRVERGGSATYPLGATEKMLQGEVGGLGDAGVKLAIDTARLGGRITTGTIFDETLHRIKAKQMESYYEALSAALFDPNAKQIIDDAYKYFSRLGYTAGQGVARAFEKVLTLTRKTVTVSISQMRMTSSEYKRKLRRLRVTSHRCLRELTLRSSTRFLRCVAACQAWKSQAPLSCHQSKTESSL
jgi:hypothetical protein